MLQILQSLIDLIVSIRFRNETLELDPARGRHLKHFLDIMGSPARHPGDGDFARDKAAAADGERAVA